MTSTDVSALVDRLWRAEAASMLGALSRRLGDFDLAEEALSEAVTAALKLLARRGRAGAAHRVAGDHRLAQGTGPAAPRGGRAGEARPHRRRAAATAGRRRPARDDLRLLPPGPGRTGPRRADPVRRERPDHRRDRRRVPGAGADDGAAAGPGEAAAAGAGDPGRGARPTRRPGCRPSSPSSTWCSTRGTCPAAGRPSAANSPARGSTWPGSSPRCCPASRRSRA